MKEDKLVIRDIPVAWWLLGIGLLGLTAYLYLQADLNTSKITGMLGVIALVLPTPLTITADRETHLLTLRYGMLIQRSIKRIPFHEIRTIQVDSQRTRSGSRSDRQTSYRMELIKKDGTAVPFHAYYSSGSGLKNRRAGELRAFIGL